MFLHGGEVGNFQKSAIGRFENYLIVFSTPKSIINIDTR